MAVAGGTGRCSVGTQLIMDRCVEVRTQEEGSSGMSVRFLVSPSLLSARLGASVSTPFPCLRSAVIWKDFALLLGTSVA